MADTDAYFLFLARSFSYADFPSDPFCVVSLQVFVLFCFNQIDINKNDEKINSYHMHLYIHSAMKSFVTRKSHN